MWLFTKHGFYSVVKGRRSNNTIMIRARDRTHLENLIQEVPELAGYVIVETAGTDYRFRIVTNRDVWDAVAVRLAAQVDYDNFKDEAGKNAFLVGWDYIDALHSVWDTMFELQSRVLLSVKRRLVNRRHK